MPALVGFVREFLQQEGLASEQAFDLDLVIEELFTNLIKYARGDRGAIDVGLTREGGKLIVTLCEQGAEFHDPTSAPHVDVDRPIGERVPGGLGIHLVRKLSEDFHYEWRDGRATTTVTMRMKD